jgi:hypothetical protein
MNGVFSRGTGNAGGGDGILAIGIVLWTRFSPQEELMRLWDSVLIKILAVISVIALVSVTQALIQGN